MCLLVVVQVWRLAGYSAWESGNAGGEAQAEAPEWAWGPAGCSAQCCPWLQDGALLWWHCCLYPGNIHIAPLHLAVHSVSSGPPPALRCGFVGDYLKGWLSLGKSKVWVCLFVVGSPCLYARCPPKLLCHSPPQLDKGGENTTKGLWVEIRPGRDHSEVAAMGKINSTWGN